MTREMRRLRKIERLARKLMPYLNHLGADGERIELALHKALRACPSPSSEKQRGDKP